VVGFGKFGESDETDFLHSARVSVFCTQICLAEQIVFTFHLYPVSLELLTYWHFSIEGGLVFVLHRVLPFSVLRQIGPTVGGLAKTIGPLKTNKANNNK
jgi:hypothetical protein